MRPEGKRLKKGQDRDPLTTQYLRERTNKKEKLDVDGKPAALYDILIWLRQEPGTRPCNCKPLGFNARLRRSSSFIRWKRDNRQAVSEGVAESPRWLDPIDRDESLGSSKRTALPTSVRVGQDGRRLRRPK